MSYEGETSKSDKERTSKWDEGKKTCVSAHIVLTFQEHLMEYIYDVFHQENPVYSPRTEGQISAFSKECSQGALTVFSKQELMYSIMSNWFITQWVPGAFPEAYMGYFQEVIGVFPKEYLVYSSRSTWPIRKEYLVYSPRSTWGISKELCGVFLKKYLLHSQWVLGT